MNINPQDIDSQIDDELQRVQIGDVNDEKVAAFVDIIEQTNIDVETKNGKLLKRDGSTLLKLSRLVVYNMASLCDDSGMRLNSARFAERLKQIDAQTNDPNALPFHVIGTKYGHLLHNPPKFTFTRPCVKFTERQIVRVKKERTQTTRRADRNLPKTQIQGKSAAQAQDEKKDNQTFSEEVDHVKKLLRAAFKRSPDQSSVGYYEFVLNPGDFGESIQNMFHVAFLLRDGHVRLTVDKRTNLPVLKKLPRDELERITTAERSALDMTQAVSRMTVPIWQGLVKRLNITKPMITRENNDEEMT
ncbi:EP-interacting inhibitor of differentiation 3 [Ditylenchus destructor]|uniref:Non-structural maintenance of chromosomes element 4 n=1 Tax=Ditylenchus destructor TaxID=166010 RepID=A0AAD4R1Q1_9BILA|nr:EP-interacting inhibitor of differentiation 3 [Ditylenchus destructor]